MKTDASGGDSAEDGTNDGLEARLSGRFAVELDGAERDYPALRSKLEGNVPAPGRSGRGRWPKFALPAAAAACLAVTVLIVSGLLSGTATGPDGAFPGPSRIALGTDGIPNQIDGQHVYRLAAQADWQNLSGSFLLGAYAVDAPIPCAPPLPSAQPQSSPENALVPQCGVVELVPKAQDNSEYFSNLAPRGLEALTGWLNGPAIVMRVHTHDPDAAGCSADQKSSCNAAVVVEAVVWPVFPQIAGERVYRAADQASFPTTGSFLLGGPFAKPQFVPPCPMQPGLNASEQQLIPYCYILRIDNLELAPQSNIDEPNGEIVVARVHIDDPQAAQCPASDRAQCQAAIVVEAVVWRGETPATSASPAPGETGSPNPASSETAGPLPSTGSGVIGPDGVPTLINGETVYRAADLPTLPAFLLGGLLTRDMSCAAPATPLAKPPACGYWMVDGVKVGTMVDLPESLLGQAVIARVERGRALSICLQGSCTANTLVVDAVVWPAGELVPPPPAPSPTPAAS
jgi:hypothetical protein